MNLYCKITLENDEWKIQEGPGPLPICTEYISNFYLITDLEILRNNGWVPYEKITEDKEVFVSSSVEVTPVKVIETVVTRDKTIEEKNADEWILVRRQRDELLVASDTNVLIDRWLALTDLQRTELTAYRQLLRDLPQTYSNPFSVVWPTKPF